MKKISRNLITTLFTLSIFNPAISNSNVIISGISSTIDGINKFYDGINNFITSIQTITGIIGFNTITLFIFILFLSAGLSAIGIQKGKISFVISLLLADCLWIIWEKSFGVEPYEYIFKIAKTNLIILIPITTIIIINKTFPLLKKNISKILNKKLRSRKYNKKILIDLNNEIQKNYFYLQTTLINDMCEFENEKSINLSDNTRKNIKKLSESLDKFKENKL